MRTRDKLAAAIRQAATEKRHEALAKKGAVARCRHVWCWFKHELIGNRHWFVCGRCGAQASRAWHEPTLSQFGNETDNRHETPTT